MWGCTSSKATYQTESCSTAHETNARKHSPPFYWKKTAHNKYRMIIDDAIYYKNTFNIFQATINHWSILIMTYTSKDASIYVHLSTEKRQEITPSNSKRLFGDCSFIRRCFNQIFVCLTQVESAYPVYSALYTRL